MSSVLEFWRSKQGLRHITPQSKSWPEGDNFPQLISRIVGPGTILDFGCGIGRLAGCFDPRQYVGVDVSELAIARARENWPLHKFYVVGNDHWFPTTKGVTLAHTVLLHVPDADLAAVVERFTSECVIVSEILGRHWRRDGGVPVFNRGAEEYASVLAPRYRLASSTTRPYPHYTDTDLTLLEFELC
jgi:SAM-dependent methyltransferase